MRKGGGCACQKMSNFFLVLFCVPVARNPVSGCQGRSPFEAGTSSFAVVCINSGLAASSLVLDK